MGKTIEERFWEKVNWQNPTERGCWLWVAGTRRRYGRFRAAERTFYSAHRFAYEWAHGPIPDGMKVLHRCDNPPCCNPEHLFLGTNNDNMKDMVKKDRQARGEQTRRGSLTRSQVEVIRFRYEEEYQSITQERLAREYGVSRRTISFITTRRTWKHV